jgi:membrane-associated phospholipid phosphatase
VIQLRRTLAAAAVFVVAAVAFAVLAVAVAQRSGPLGPDGSALHDVVDWRSGGLTFLAKGLTALGTDVAVYSALIIGALLCAWRKERPLAGVLAVAILITGQLVRLAINHTIARPRPPAGLRLVHAGGFSFPSGHATLATLAYGLLAVLLSMSFPRYRWIFGAAAVVLAVGVGLSRVYLAVHWTTDVAGGWLFGISWLALAAVLVSSIPALSWVTGRAAVPREPAA